MSLYIENLTVAQYTDIQSLSPSKHKTIFNVCVMLVQRLRRWPNFKPAFVQRVVFTDQAYPVSYGNTKLQHSPAKPKGIICLLVN